MESDTFKEDIKVIDWWKTKSQEEYRLVNLGAGPLRLQVKQGEEWVEEKSHFSWGVITKRLESLLPLRLTNEKYQELINQAHLSSNAFECEMGEAIQSIRRELDMEKQNNFAERLKVTNLEKKYSELIMEVEQKFPDETRHETALKLIKKAQVSSGPHEEKK